MVGLGLSCGYERGASTVAVAIWLRHFVFPFIARCVSRAPCGTFNPVWRRNTHNDRTRYSRHRRRLAPGFFRLLDCNDAIVVLLVDHPGSMVCEKMVPEIVGYRVLSLLGSADFSLLHRVLFFRRIQVTIQYCCRRLLVVSDGGVREYSRLISALHDRDDLLCPEFGVGRCGVLVVPDDVGSADSAGSAISNAVDWRGVVAVLVADDQFVGDALQFRSHTE